PARALEYLNQGLLEENFDPPLLVTMAIAVINGRNGEVTCACAGHPSPVVVSRAEADRVGEADGVGEAKRPGGRSSFLPVFGPALGVRESPTFETARMILEPGDFLLLYTDGIPEARNAGGEELGYERLARGAAHWHGRPPSDIARNLEEMLHDHRGMTPFYDDVSFVVIQYSAPEAIGVPCGEESRKNVEVVLPGLAPQEHSPLRAGISGGWADGGGAAGPVGLTDPVGVIRISGKGTWHLGQALRTRLASLRGEADGVGEADRVGEAAHGPPRSAAPIHVDLAACESLDSTVLGLLHQFADEILLHQPCERVSSQLSELGLLDRLKISDRPAPKPDRLFLMPAGLAAKDPSDLILSAHESLMDASEENRRRFRAVVDLVRKRQSESRRRQGEKPAPNTG
ncbi:MAG TPA: PP2C family protein-serine/threonine phosphatase, partial [Sumerlaeia bacterium]|nr:PP2C family protein-serine/threonine phosphatase [Sumerlaeia bacterium]